MRLKEDKNKTSVTHVRALTARNIFSLNFLSRPVQELTDTFSNLLRRETLFSLNVWHILTREAFPLMFSGRRGQRLSINYANHGAAAVFNVL